MSRTDAATPIGCPEYVYPWENAPILSAPSSISWYTRSLTIDAERGTLADVGPFAIVIEALHYALQDFSHEDV
jgi:hypothetical protein